MNAIYKALENPRENVATLVLYEEYNKVTGQGHRARTEQNKVQTQAS